MKHFSFTFHIRMKESVGKAITYYSYKPRFHPQFLSEYSHSVLKKNITTAVNKKGNFGTIF